MGVSFYLLSIILLPHLLPVFCFANAAGSTGIWHGLQQPTLQHMVPEPGLRPDTSAKVLSFQVITSGLYDATSIDITPDDNIYVVESGANRILKLDKNGSRLDSLGRMGFGDYRFDRPLDVDATNGLKIYVSDYNNRRIQIFDRRLQYLSTIEPGDISGHGRAYRPTGIVVNTFGELFVLDEEQERLLKFDRNGRFQFELDLRVQGIRGLPVSLAAAGNMLFLPDPVGGMIHLISDSGNYIRFIGGMQPISAVGTSAGGTVWTVSSGEVQELDQRGRVLRKFTIEIPETVRSVAAGKENLYLLVSDRIYKSVIPPVSD